MKPTENLSIIDNLAQEYQVELLIVSDVLDYDFPQAKIAWQALEDAGMDPGELIINALSIGHEYRLTRFLVNNIIFSKIKNFSESLTNDSKLISYKVNPEPFFQDLIDFPLNQIKDLIVFKKDITKSLVSNKLRLIAILRSGNTKISQNINSGLQIQR